MGETGGASPGFVRFQQAMAQRAVLRGELRAARVALRVLRAKYFWEREVAESALAVLRDTRSTDDELIEAIARLVLLEPAAR